jgi:hypothetical protein
VADGQIIYNGPVNDMRLRIFKVLGHPEMSDDERFNTTAGLLAGDNLAIAGSILVKEFEKRTVEEILTSFQEAQIPVAPSGPTRSRRRAGRAQRDDRDVGAPGRWHDPPDPAPGAVQQRRDAGARVGAGAR